MNPEPELRIGDAEREAAASALGDHFASGRLTRDEYDERSSQVWSAKTNSDLWPLFLDLPSPAVTHPRTAAGTSRSTGASGQSRPDRWGHVHGFRPPFLLIAVALVVLAFALPGPPWLLIPLVWLWCSGAFGSSPRYSRGRDRADRGRWA